MFYCEFTGTKAKNNFKRSVEPIIHTEDITQEGDTELVIKFDEDKLAVMEDILEIKKKRKLTQAQLETLAKYRVPFNKKKVK